MIKIEKQKNNNTKNTSLETPTNNNKVINTSTDTRKATNSTIERTEINDNKSLYSRDISTQPNTINTYQDKISQVVKIYALQSIELQIKLITKVDTTYSVPYNANDSLEYLASKWAEGACIMYNLKIDNLPATQEAEEVVLNSIFEKLVEESKKYGLDIVYNGGICWNMLATFFKRQCENDEDRKKFCQLQLTQNKNDKLIRGIDAVINQAIINLEKCKNEIYFSKFRTIIDLNETLYSKYQRFRHYFHLPELEVSLDVGITFRILAKVVLPSMRTMIGQVCNLQILLDIFKEMKKVPKTTNNVKLLLNICNVCIRMFESDSKLYKINTNQSLNSQYTNDYLHVKSLLKTFDSQLRTLINSQSDDWTSPHVKAFLNKNSVKKTVAKHKGKENKRIYNDNHSTQPKPAIVNEAIEDPIIEPNRQEDQNNVEQKPTETKPATDKTVSGLADNNEQSHDTNSLAEDYEEIERETNVLMEVFRQRLENDRKVKLERKEQKEFKAKVVETPIEEPVPTEKETKTPFIKLSNPHQETLRELFKEKPEHFIIDAASVENLITALKGKTKGNGNGSQFTIYWGNSKKQAGIYEVAHARDAKGYLTSTWASNVADAIKVGVKYGLIAPETIAHFDA